MRSSVISRRYSKLGRFEQARASSPSVNGSSALRLGLCCQFAEHPIRFRTTTATCLLRLKPKDRRKKLAELCVANAESLLAALRFCAEHAIGCFRICSSILPIKTHPRAGYSVGELPQADTIVAKFRLCGEFAVQHGIRTVFHPDQFVVLNSPREDVVEKSIEELKYQAEVAEWVGADVINIHGGGGYSDKARRVGQICPQSRSLSDAARSRLTVENDDKVYTPTDLLPLCRANGLPLVYHAHHHRCLPDELSIEAATAAALHTWNRQPLFHISSPLDGWNQPQPSRHHDFIAWSDFPTCWRSLPITVEVEAKAKELAVLRLMNELASKRPRESARNHRASNLRVKSH